MLSEEFGEICDFILFFRFLNVPLCLELLNNQKKSKK